MRDIFKGGAGAVIAAAASICLAAALVPCAPAQAQMAGQVNLPSIGAPAGSGELSPAEEYEIGRHYMNALQESKYYLDDPDSAEYLNRLGYRLVAAGPSSGYSFRFFPMAVPQINAFAMPGGFVAVFSGTVVAARHEEELAGVIAHEVAHVTQRHIARMIENQRGTTALTVGSFLLAILAAAAGGGSGAEAASAVVAGSQAALIADQLKFSRSAEREADRIGFATLVGAGFDPDGMTRFFQRLLQRTGIYESNANAYLSDHPLTVERIAEMQDRARSYRKPFFRRNELDFKLMQARLTVLQGERKDDWEASERQFRKALAGASGEDAAVLHYGISVAAQKLGKTAAALESAKAASSLGRRGNVFLEKNLLHAEFLAARSPDGKRSAAEALVALSDRNPLSTMLVRTAAEDLHAAGRYADAIRFIKRQGAISNEDALYHTMLARSCEAAGRMSEAYYAIGRANMINGKWKLAVYQLRQAQRSSDADFYTMSEIDAALREAEQRTKEIEKDRR